MKHKTNGKPCRSVDFVDHFPLAHFFDWEISWVSPCFMGPEGLLISGACSPAVLIHAKGFHLSKLLAKEPGRVAAT